MTIPVKNLIAAADSVNIRLEIVCGVPVWEANPSDQHQIEIDRIRASIKRHESSTCARLHVADVLFHFPDGTLKRSDIAVMGQAPQVKNPAEALPIMPDAVIEIASPENEYRDYELGPPSYLSADVRDVIVFDPRSKHVLHHRKDGTQRLESAVQIKLECDRECVV
jgi:Uma2 family endonuclease